MGCFLGVSENCGYTFTFHILTRNERIILRSALHSLNSEDNPNVYPEQKEQKASMHALGKILQIPELSMLDSLVFIGQGFMHKYAKIPIKATVVASLGDDQCKVN